uniref:Acetyl-CoA carboxylase n=1 Tax=Rhabditophanes sp. KR3021 TaxID=114890 RepID=A0AC35U7F3_9BILA
MKQEHRCHHLELLLQDGKYQNEISDMFEHRHLHRGKFGSSMSDSLRTNTFDMGSYLSHGMCLSNAKPSEKTFQTIENFVKAFCDDDLKSKPIKKILVATNGIAAVKCILSIRKFLMQFFKNDRIVKFVCMTTNQEIESHAEYLKIADYVVLSPSGANTNNYANVDEIIEHAVANKVDAVWAGWGHASENPRLPKELAENDIVFIGPCHEAVFCLGDKISSTIIAQTVNIPTIEWSGSGLIAPEPIEDGGDEKMLISEQLYRSATVSSVEDGFEVLKRCNIHYPIMIKASEGGGGKGIRKCISNDEFADNFRRVQAEVPGSPIFLMKCLTNARHIEVQLIGDIYGDVIPIYTRDCSIQRRCQKIIEEAPAAIAPVHILRKMQQDAVNLAKKVGYYSAGTVEYMYLPESQTYYFLELNPRLQVEHPCTEMISNINIPAVQLQVAMGLPLKNIVDIRLFFGLDRFGRTPLPEDQIKTNTDTHVVSCRITSEDPAEGFRPSSGLVNVLNLQSNQNAWGYFSISSNGQIHEFSDSQFGHIFAKGTSRKEAISNMLCALNELEIQATFTSQVRYLEGLLRDPDFEKNRFNTGWLEARIAAKIHINESLPLHVSIAVGATAIGHSKIEKIFTTYENSVGRGQILPTTNLTETMEIELILNGIKYRALVTRMGPINYIICTDESKCHVEVRSFERDSLLLSYAENSYICSLFEDSDFYKVTIGKTLVKFEKENDPSILRSFNAGRLLQFLKKEGEYVSVGDVYAEMESMKMVINLEIKKAGGKMMLVAKPGQILFPGTLIARLEDQKNTPVRKYCHFKGRIEEWDRYEEMNADNETRLHLLFNSSLEYCNHILNGYSVPEIVLKNEVEKLVKTLIRVLKDPNLPRFLFTSVLSAVSTRIPIEVYNKISFFLEEGKKSNTFYASLLVEEMEGYLCTVDPKNICLEKSYFESLINICENFDGGINGHIKLIVEDLLTKFLNIEQYFQNVSYDMAVLKIKSNIKDPKKVVRMIYSHTKISVKDDLFIKLIAELDDDIIWSLRKILKVIANLSDAGALPLAVFVRDRLNLLKRNDCSKVLQNFINQNNFAGIDILQFSDQYDTFFNTQSVEPELDVLPQFFFPHDSINVDAIRCYIEKIFGIRKNTIITVFNNNKIALLEFTITKANSIYQFVPHTHNSDVQKFSIIVGSDFNNLTLESNYLSQLNGNISKILYIIRDSQNVLNVNEVNVILSNHLAASSVIQKANFSANIILVRNLELPIYLTHKFGLNEKLQLYRLDENAKRITNFTSSFVTYKHRDEYATRYFIRQLIKDIIPPKASAFSMKTTSNTDIIKARLMEVLDSACGEIKVLAFKNQKSETNDCNHILLCIEIYEYIPIEEWSNTFESVILESQELLIKNRVSEIELIYNEPTQNDVMSKSDLSACENQEWKTYKFVYSNKSNVYPKIILYQVVNGTLEPYFEHQDIAKRVTFYEKHEYIKIYNIQKRRLTANKLNTTFVYDLPLVFGRALLRLWENYAKSDPENYKIIHDRLDKQKQRAIFIKEGFGLLQANEMIIEDDDTFCVCDDKNELKKRAINCLNNRGMVAWEIHMFTPDAPLHGRTIVVIANDITFQSGSFSMKEHNMYYEASKYSRKHGYPRIYISVNSGARIGLAADVKNKLSVNWINEEAPEDGFCCLSVDNDGDTDEIFNQIKCSNSHGHLSLDAVVGREKDIGVENLVGSGLIAGETSAAYNEVPTYCLVSGRAVGIGAYAARLCHRVCQVENSHIILTGAPALNSLLGKEIYTCNNQLGGTQITFNNGISHSIVKNDLEGCVAILKWITYLPSPELPLYMPMAKDDGSRSITFKPTRTPYDPRKMLDNLYEDGLFDKGSFDEIMNGWAKTIIVGRARLRGLAVGVIAVETRSVECVIPADPAVHNSESQVVTQAGQVWYPDSAYKTSEAINDFNREGLPIIMIANIRGFSGGQKDMFEMVLKFGANIIDALQTYTQPVIVYIPPFGSLRGGSWAVVDTKINPNCISMFADSTARGGILEPEAVVKIKFKHNDLVTLMYKCDGTLKSLQKEFDNVYTTESRRNELSKLISSRKKVLLPIYENIAVKFADLHDTTTRLLARDAIKDEVPLELARDYFYEVLKSELAVNHMAKQYLECKNVSNLDITITKLNEAYEWLRKLLNLENVHYIHKTGKDVGSRLSYDSKIILDFATSDKFKALLSKAKSEELAVLFEKFVYNKYDAGLILLF